MEVKRKRVEEIEKDKNGNKYKISKEREAEKAK